MTGILQPRNDEKKQSSHSSGIEIKDAPEGEFMEHSDRLYIELKEERDVDDCCVLCLLDR